MLDTGALELADRLLAEPLFDRNGLVVLFLSFRAEACAETVVILGCIYCYLHELATDSSEI